MASIFSARYINAKAIYELLVIEMNKRGNVQKDTTPQPPKIQGGETDEYIRWVERLLNMLIHDDVLICSLIAQHDKVLQRLHHPTDKMKRLHKIKWKV